MLRPHCQNKQRLTFQRALEDERMGVEMGVLRKRRLPWYRLGKTIVSFRKLAGNSRVRDFWEMSSGLRLNAKEARRGC